MKRNEIERSVSIPLGIRLSRAITVAPCMVKIQPFGGQTVVISPGRRPWRCYMLGRALPRLYGSLSAVPTRFKNTVYYIWVRFDCGNCAQFSVLTLKQVGAPAFLTAFNYIVFSVI